MKPLPELSAAERELLARARALRPPESTARATGWRRLQQEAITAPPRLRDWLLVPAAAALALTAVVVFGGWPRDRPPTHALPSALGALDMRVPAAASETAAPGVTGGSNVASADRPAAVTGPAPVAKTARADTSAATWHEQILGPPSAPRGRLQVRDGSALQIHGSARVDLTEGKLCAEIAHRDLPREGPFLIVAPQVRVTVLGTHFCVETLAGRTMVSVTEGRVRVENAQGAVALVGAGEAVQSDELSTELSAEPSTAAATARCPAQGPLQAREDCAAQLSAGSGLSAQNALFALALLARDEGHDGPAAASYFRSFLGRFPQAPLAPEASIGLLRELRAQSRDGEALGEADRYLARYASDGREADVLLLRAHLLRERLGRPREALADYQRVLTEASTSALRGEALYGLATSQGDLGETAQQRRSLDRYLREYPQGDHAAQAARERDRLPAH